MGMIKNLQTAARILQEIAAKCYFWPAREHIYRSIHLQQTNQPIHCRKNLLNDYKAQKLYDRIGHRTDK